MGNIARCLKPLLLLGCLALVMPAMSAAAPKPPIPPAQDSVTGAGINNVCGPLEIDFRSNPIGGNPAGEVRCPPGGTFLTGRVICLNVQGNVALVTSEAGSFDPTSWLLTRVTDNGATGDKVEMQTQQDPDCGGTPRSPSSILGSPATSSWWTPPLPTSKDQCKDGGWRNFPGFKNQGTCVSFVATVGTNHPAG